LNPFLSNIERNSGNLLKRRFYHHELLKSNDTNVVFTDIPSLTPVIIKQEPKAPKSRKKQKQIPQTIIEEPEVRQKSLRPEQEPKPRKRETPEPSTEPRGRPRRATKIPREWWKTCGHCRTTKRCQTIFEGYEKLHQSR